MSKFEKATEKSGIALGDYCSPRDPVDVLAHTFDSDPKVRRLTAKVLCPCHVKANAAYRRTGGVNVL
jgi:hypothetical protein